ncbi:19261_t:CDS:2 [Cetraspora pellucida]|uniref:19261_t:CDS:1 n=1 Tax=Cetraspora pellucida TaxID=1433469 RepID=A0A9N9EMS1_9GLOM|nr:19261_t:CDS:2 [Cetraspora pellucida]
MKIPTSNPISVFESTELLCSQGDHAHLTNGIMIASAKPETGKIFGVSPYIAPKVLQGQPYTKTSDVYSFGIVAYELLANSYHYYDEA